MARRPFASLLAVAGLGVVLVVALLLVAIPHPVALPPSLAETVKRCLEPSGLCQNLVRIGHTVASPLLLALLIWALVQGLGSGSWQWWTTRRALRRLRSRGMRKPAGLLRTLCAELGLAGKVTLLVTDMPLAFCHGLWRPRVWLSTGTLALLSRQEVAAVLRHEQTHLRGRHPLQLLVARSLVAALPFLPVLRELAEALPAAQELVADQAVIRAGQRDALGRALLTLVERQGQALPLSLAPGVVGTLAARIDLLTGAETKPARLSRRALLHTWLVFGLGLLLLRLSTLGLPPQHSLPALPPMSVLFSWHCLALPVTLCGTAHGLHAVLARARRRTRWALPTS